MYVHFSVDDTAEILRDIREHAYTDVFQNETLAFLKALHGRFGICVSLYVFDRTDGFLLSDFPVTYRAQFLAASDWLRFGVHAKEMNAAFRTPETLADYREMHATCVRLFGKASIDLCPRPHFFAMHPEVIATLSRDGSIRGLMCPDDDRACYGFTEREYAALKERGVTTRNGCLYARTEKRLECLDLAGIEEIFATRAQTPLLSFFTHECHMEKPSMREKITRVCTLADASQRAWCFPADLKL